jgi:hypothetical protein
MNCDKLVTPLFDRVPSGRIVRGWPGSLCRRRDDVSDDRKFGDARRRPLRRGVHHLASLLMKRRLDGRPHPHRTFTGPPIDRFFDNFPLVAVDSCLVYSSIMQGRSIVELPQRSNYG